MWTRLNSASISAPQSGRLTEHEWEEVPGEEFFAQGPFLKVLHLEQMRAERSGRRFALMLIESKDLLARVNNNEVVDKLLSALRDATRATDVTGWYEEGAAIGVIFTEIGGADVESVTKALRMKVTKVFTDSLSTEQFNQIHICFHVFPGLHEGQEIEEPLRWTPIFALKQGWLPLG